MSTLRFCDLSGLTWRLIACPLLPILASAAVIAIAWLVRLGLGRWPSGWPVAAKLVVDHSNGLLTNRLRLIRRRRSNERR